MMVISVALRIRSMNFPVSHCVWTPQCGDAVESNLFYSNIKIYSLVVLFAKQTSEIGSCLHSSLHLFVNATVKRKSLKVETVWPAS